MLSKLLCASLAGALLLGGCTVYLPTVPSTPLLSKGQAQVSAGVRNLSSLEAGAAWAPTRHLLLSAESAYQVSEHRQLSLGLGYYRAPVEHSRWYLAALGGMGYASAKAPSMFTNITFFPVPYNLGNFEAHYFRYYGQVYAARPTRKGSMRGFSLRGIWVDYARLLRNDQAVAPTNHFFIEPSLFMKYGNGPFQGMVTGGLSLPVQRDDTSTFNELTSPVSTYLSVTLIFRPDLLRRRD